jgi:transcriptional regulator with XRE-family HTH domain
MDIRRQVGLNVLRLRRMRNISQEALALEAEITRSYMSTMERGKSNPTILVLERLAWGLGTTVAELVAPVPEPALLRQGEKPKRKGTKPGRRSK